MANRREKRERMRALLERWQRSGESAAAYGRRHGIHPQKLAYWKRVLGTGEAKRVRGEKAAARFVPVQVVGTGVGFAGGGIEIMVGTEYRLVVHEGVSRELLREVLTAVREAC